MIEDIEPEIETEIERDRPVRLRLKVLCTVTGVACVLVLAALVHPLELPLGGTRLYLRAEHVRTPHSPYRPGLHWTDLAGTGGRNTYISLRVGERALVAGRLQKIRPLPRLAGG